MNQKALPPASGQPNVTESLDMAMDGISLAIGEILKDRYDNHRFGDVMRLATIGKAIGRQKARTSKRVEDYVEPQNRCVQRRGGYVCNVNDYGALGGQGDEEDMEDVENIARDEEDPADDLADRVQRARRAVNRVRVRQPGWIGAPRLGNNDGEHVDDAFAQGVEMFRPMFDDMRETNERRADIEEAEAQSKGRLDLARELDSLTRVRERMCDGDEKEAIQRRIDEVVAQIELGPDDEEDEDAEDEDDETEEDANIEEPYAAAPPELQIRCLSCGNVHGRHWVTDNGVPRDCDICDAAMTLELIPTDDTPQPQVAQG